MMMGETPSPPRAGRFGSCGASRQALHPELGIVPAAGKVGEQVERLGQHVVGRHRLERRHVDEGEDLAQLLGLRRVGAEAGGGEAAGVARVEEDGAAVLHEGVDLRHRLGGGRRLVGIDRPVDQRVEGKLVGGDVDRRRLARLERGAVGEIHGKALEAGAAGLVELRVAGHDIGELRLRRGGERLLHVAVLRRAPDRRAAARSDSARASAAALAKRRVRRPDSASTARPSRIASTAAAASSHGQIGVGRLRLERRRSAPASRSRRERAA